MEPFCRCWIKFGYKVESPPPHYPLIILYPWEERIPQKPDMLTKKSCFSRTCRADLWCYRGCAWAGQGWLAGGSTIPRSDRAGFASRPAGPPSQRSGSSHRRWNISSINKPVKRSQKNDKAWRTCRLINSYLKIWLINVETHYQTVLWKRKLRNTDNLVVLERLTFG